jgi:glycosyltransferase involved in cell wall biosynthesis
MKISVAIPTYNSAAFITDTLASVFAQTRPADEILILDDGSKDDTVAALKMFGDKITVLQQPNRGVAGARNELCRRASGDLIAFLDHDDSWHPNYLEIQGRRAEEHPDAAAYFAWHENFYGVEAHKWSAGVVEGEAQVQVIPPIQFVDRYNNSTGTFYSMSFCCLPKSLLAKLPGPPFNEEVTGVDDCYLGNLLPLYGPVIFTPAKLVAYRITAQAQSANHLRNFQNVVKVFELLQEQYERAGDLALLQAFHRAFAGKRRRYGKTLMDAGRQGEARAQFRRAMAQSSCARAMAKSASLLCLSYLPGLLQPRWPSSTRTATRH